MADQTHTISFDKAQIDEMSKNMLTELKKCLPVRMTIVTEYADGSKTEYPVLITGCPADYAGEKLQNEIIKAVHDYSLKVNSL